METETWIERLLIDQLTTHDERYTHDYGEADRTTDELVGACMRLESVLTPAESEPSSIEGFLSAEEFRQEQVSIARRCGKLPKRFG